VKRLAFVICTLTAAIGSASGADMALKAPPVPSAPTWTGFYAGLNVGYAWGDPRTDIAANGSVASLVFAGFPGFPSNFAFTDSDHARPSGLIGGGQIGFNYQLNRRWLVGVEADLQAASQSGSNAFSDQFSTPVCVDIRLTGFPPSACRGTAPLIATAATKYEAKIDGFGTLRGRAGYLITDQVLIYGTGGLAYGRVEINGNASVPVAAITGGPTDFVQSAGTFAAARNNLGYSIGGGIEGKIFPWLPANWSWKAEYLYLDLGSLDTGTSFSGVFPGGRIIPIWAAFTSPVALHTRFVDNIVRVGLNYKFGN
jgi:outer membrane immunogenic protein